MVQCWVKEAAREYSLRSPVVLLLWEGCSSSSGRGFAERVEKNLRSVSLVLRPVSAVVPGVSIATVAESWASPALLLIQHLDEGLDHLLTGNLALGETFHVDGVGPPSGGSVPPWCGSTASWTVSVWVPPDGIPARQQVLSVFSAMLAVPALGVSAGDGRWSVILFGEARWGVTRPYNCK